MRVRYFGLGLFVGAGGAAVYLRSRQQALETVRDPVDHKTLKYGAPGLDRLRFFDDFVVSFDPRTKGPEWVLERISWTDKPRVGDRKNVEFKEDEAFEERFRSRLVDYRGSGYDRGHMAPAANHKADQKAMDSTFLLTNVCPQVGTGFNRDYWARFERFVNQLTKSCKEVFIVTGPLYLPHKTPGGYEMRHPFIGEPPSLVSVPTHFFKVILGDCNASETGEGNTALGAFVMPNAPIDPEIPLTAFAVPLHQLEALSGLHFFPGFISRTRQAFHDQVALSWQSRGRQQLLEQQTLRTNSLFNPIRNSAPPTDPLIGLSVLSPARENPPEASLPALLEELQVTDQGQNHLGAAKHDLPKPGSHLLHNDVCTAAPLLQKGSQGVRPDATTAEDLAAAVASTVADPEVDPVSEIQSPLREQITIDRKHPLGAVRRRQAAVLEGASAEGVIHVCDHTKCILPPPDWYLKRKQALVDAAVSGEELASPA